MIATVALTGCPARHLRRALDLRISETFTDVPPPRGGDAFQIGVAASVPAVQERLRASVAAIGGLGLRELDALSLPGLGGIRLTLSWDDLVTELRPTADPSAVHLLLALPGTVRADAGILAVENPLRLSARVPLALEASLSGGNGLELLAHIGPPDDLLMAVSLQGVPPGMDSALSATLQSAVREHLRTTPPAPIPLVAVERLPGGEGTISLADARVLAFPGGRPTLFLGLQTSLPVSAAPSVVPEDLLPGEEDWAVKIDQQVVSAILARAALSGNASPVKLPDRLEPLTLEMSPQGFVAEIVLWRLRPPARRIELVATGGIAWEEDRLALTILDLTRADGGPIPGRKLPWHYRTPPLDTPWGITTLETVDGALFASGSFPVVAEQTD